MTIQGIQGYALPTVLPGGTRAPAPQGPDAPSQGLGATRPTGSRPAEAAARAAGSVPMDAPAGTDPMLWSVLTSEERSFFARARALGQITYGPGTRSHGASVPRGGRVDVRV